MLVLYTARLDLVAATPELARAEADGRPEWHAPLGVQPPIAWPPPLNDHRSLARFAARLAADPAGVGWYAWHVVRRSTEDSDRALIGNCGFTGRPDGHGSVEIGYALLEPYQGHGFGTELVSALAGWAFTHPDVARVLAQTYLEFVASVRVLEKNGFQLTSRRSRSGLLLFELRRTVFERRQRPTG